MPMSGTGCRLCVTTTVRGLPHAVMSEQLPSPESEVSALLAGRGWCAGSRNSTPGVKALFG